MNENGPTTLKNCFDTRYNVKSVRSQQLRPRNNIPTPLCKTKLYRSSFFPFAIKLWNSLDDNSKNAPTLSIFKSYLKIKDKPRKIFYYGERMMNVLHARMRMGCSPLRSHLCLLMHVIDNSNCDCGCEIESPRHYFLECPIHNGPRNFMIRSIENVTDCNINTILFGNKKLSYLENKTIFKSVHKFIKDSRRFVTENDPGMCGAAL